MFCTLLEQLKVYLTKNYDFVCHTQKGGGCKTGCRDSRDLMVSNGNLTFVYAVIYQLGVFCLDQLPAAPIGSDIILLSASNGSFLLDVRNTQPNNTNVSSSIHSFVVRVESDDITKYWWMVSSCVASHLYM